MATISTSLNATVHGDAGDTVVLAHGFGSDQSVWRDQVPWLSERFRVVTYDLACAGTVTDFFDAGRHEALEGHASDLIDLLRELEIGRCTLVGHSVSGMIGILATLARPELFERLILLGASACYLDDGNYHGGFAQETIGAILDAIRQNYHEWAKSFGPFALDRPLEDPVSQTFVGSLLRMRPDVAVVMAKAIFLSDYRAILPQCIVPCAVLQTRHDPAVPFEAAKYLHDHLRMSSLDVLDAVGHLPHLSAPAEARLALQRHLRGGPASHGRVG